MTTNPITLILGQPMRNAYLLCRYSKFKIVLFRLKKLKNVDLLDFILTILLLSF